MTRNEIVIILQDFCVSHFGIMQESCIDSASFKNDFDADELDRIELAVMIENTFDIEFSDVDVDYKMVTFGNIIDLIQDKINERVKFENS